MMSIEKRQPRRVDSAKVAKKWLPEGGDGGAAEPQATVKKVG